MANVCNIFCDLLGEDAIGFCLGTERGCRRYHIDNVPKRMLVTYAGKGTEWLPDEAADREAFLSGEPNEKIIKDPSALQFINQWDVAVFRGGPEGVLHRTPDAALNGPSTVFLSTSLNVSLNDFLSPHNRCNIESMHCFSQGASGKHVGYFDACFTVKGKWCI